MAHRSSPPRDKRQRLPARIAEVLVCPECRHAWSSTDSHHSANAQYKFNGVKSAK
jgi:hypothetical protein